MMNEKDSIQNQTQRRSDGADTGVTTGKRRSSLTRVLIFVIAITMFIPVFTPLSVFAIDYTEGTTMSAIWESGSNKSTITGDSMYMVPTSNSKDNFAKAKVTFSCDGNKTYPAGSIEIRVPAKLFVTRNTMFQNGNVTVGCPKAPETSNTTSFNYTIDEETNEIVITNWADIDQVTYFECMIQYSFLPAAIVDMSNFKFTDVTTITIDDQEYQVGSKTLDTTVDTSINVQINKTFQKSFAEWENKWGARPANANDCVYGVFSVESIFNTSTQPFKYTVVDDPRDPTSGINGTVIKEGYGETYDDATYSDTNCDEGTPYEITNGDCWSGVDTFIVDRRFVIVSYPKDEVVSDGEINTPMNYARIEATGYDGAQKSMNASAWFRYVDNSYRYKGDVYGITKNAKGAENAAVAVRLLNDGEDVVSNYEVEAIGRVAKKTLQETTPPATEENPYPLPEGQFGVVETEVDLVDDIVAIDNVKLNAGDYYFKSAKVELEITDCDDTPQPLTINGYQPKESNKPLRINPTAQIYYRTEENGEWKYLKKIFGCTEQDVIFPADAIQYKVECIGAYYSIIIHSKPTVIVKPTEHVLNIIQDAMTCSITNVAHVVGYAVPGSGNVENTVGSGNISGTLQQVIYDHGQANGYNLKENQFLQTFSASNYIYNYIASASLTKKSSNATSDPENSCEHVTYTLNQNFGMRITEKGIEYMNEKGVPIVEQFGTFYDLLPLGEVPDVSTISMQRVDQYDYKEDEATYTDCAFSFETVENWRNSGRIMLIVHAIAPEQQGSVYTTKEQTLYQSGFQLSFQSSYAWGMLVDYGTVTKNDAVYLSEDVTFTGADATYDQMDPNGLDGLLKDVDNDGNPAESEHKNALFAYSQTSYKPVTSAELQYSKRVKAAKDATYKKETVTPKDGFYSYRLRYVALEGTQAQGVVIFDSLEDAYAESTTTPKYWQGTFVDIDASQPELKGVKPVYYYSTLTGLDPKNVPADANLADTAKWSTTPPANLADVKAIAVDLSKMDDGSSFVLSANETLVVKVNMRAPENVVDYLNPIVYAWNESVSLSQIRSAAALEWAEPSFQTSAITKVSLSDFIEINLEGQKNLTGGGKTNADITKNMFSFSVTPSDDNPADVEGVQPVTTEAGGLLKFGTWKFTEEGHYEFVVSENNPPFGYFKAPDITIVVDVTKVNRELSEVVTLKQDGVTVDELVFNNTYSPDSVSVPISGTKQFMRNWSYYQVDKGAGFFVTPFEETDMTCVKGVPKGVVYNDYDGNLDFGSWTFSKAGKYKFYITETKVDTEFSTRYCIVATINVTDVEGKLTATVGYSEYNTYDEAVKYDSWSYDGSSGPFSVTNYEIAKIKIALQKMVLGGGREPYDIDEREFSFRIHADEKNPSTCTKVVENVLYYTAEGGFVDYGDITFSAPGKYVFYVSEYQSNGLISVPGTGFGFFNSDYGYRITVNVTKNFLGIMGVTATYASYHRGEMTSEEIPYTYSETNQLINSIPVYKNIVPVKLNLEGQKHITGGTKTDADILKDEFSFRLYDEATGKELATTKTLAGGMFKFSNISLSTIMPNYGEAGVYVLRIKEDEPTGNYIKGDDVLVTVTVSGNLEDNTLKVDSVTYSTGDSIEITNTETKVSTPISGQKYMKYANGTLVGWNAMQFTVKADESNPARISGIEKTFSSNDSGAINFGEWKFIAEGTYKFTISEVPTDRFVEAEDVIVTIVVGHDSDNNMVIESKTYSSGDAIVFINRWSIGTEVSLMKYLSGGNRSFKGLDDDGVEVYRSTDRYQNVPFPNMFKFGVIQDKNNPMLVAGVPTELIGNTGYTVNDPYMGQTQYVYNQIQFGTWYFDKAGTYKFTFYEEDPAVTHPGDPLYADIIKGEDITLTVVVEEDSNGTLSIKSKTFDSNGSESTVMKNIIPLEYELKMYKTLTGGDKTNADIKAGEFKFSVTPDPSNPEGGLTGMPTEVTTSQGTSTHAEINFGKLTITKLGTYKFTVSEIDLPEGYTQPDDIVVTLKVNEYGYNGWEVSPSYSGTSSGTFKNIYTPMNAVNLVGKKSVNYNESNGGAAYSWSYGSRSFYFGVTEDANNPAPTRGIIAGEKAYKTDNVANISFGTWYIDKEGTYKYTIHEADDNTATMTKAEDVIVTVVAEKTSGGEIKVTSTTYSNSEGILTDVSFKNVINTVVPLFLKKTVSGNNAPTYIGGDFTFKIKPNPENEYPAYQINGAEYTGSNFTPANGSGTNCYAYFTDICFAHEGTYKFTITENDPGPLYTPSNDGVVIATVVVTKNSNGELEVSAPTYTSQSTVTATLTYGYNGVPAKTSQSLPAGVIDNAFTSTTKVHPMGNKHLIGGDYTDADIKEGEYTFTITDNTADWWTNPTNGVTGKPETVSTKAGGEIDFGEWTFTKEGTYKYVMQEVTPTNGFMPGSGYTSGYADGKFGFVVVVSKSKTNELYISSFTWQNIMIMQEYDWMTGQMIDKEYFMDSTALTSYFNNYITVTPGTLSVSADKSIKTGAVTSGDDVTANQFSFAIVVDSITDSLGESVDVDSYASNYISIPARSSASKDRKDWYYSFSTKAGGAINFSTWTISKPGTFVVRLAEKEVEGYIMAPDVLVTIVASYNRTTNKIEVDSVTYSSGDKISFVNESTVPTTDITLTGKKYVNDGTTNIDFSNAEKYGTFSFSVTSITGPEGKYSGIKLNEQHTATIANAGDLFATYNLGTESFTATGDYAFTIHETMTMPDLYEAQKDIVYTVTVSADEDDNLTATVKSIKDSDGNVLENTDFTNALKPEVGEVPFKFTKVDAKTDAPLIGADFSLYELTCANASHTHADEAVTNELLADDCYTAVKNADETEIWTSTAAGLVDFGELSTGTYVLVETKAPEGYQRPTGQWQVKIDSTAAVADQVKIKAVGTATPPAFTVENNEGALEYSLPNFQSFTYPLSGGAGAILFTVGGAALVLAGLTVVIGIFVMKKKKSKEADQKQNNTPKVI